MKPQEIEKRLNVILDEDPSLYHIIMNNDEVDAAHYVVYGSDANPKDDQMVEIGDRIDIDLYLNNARNKYKQQRGE